MKIYNLEVKFNIEMTENKFKEFKKMIKNETEKELKYPEKENVLSVRGERVLGVEYKIIKDYLDTLPTEKLININADPEQGLTFKDYYDQWKEREKLVAAGDDAVYVLKELQPDGKYKDVTYKGEDAVKAFDQDERTRNANLGNISQRQYALLMEYWAIEDKEEQAQFLQRHEAEIGIKKKGTECLPALILTLIVP